jgi:DNA mismatch repair protein MutS
VLHDVDTWNDLRLFPLSGDSAHCLLSIVDRTQTFLGRAMLASKLVQPKTDSTVLMQQQEIIKYLHANNNLYQQLRTQLNVFAKNEGMLLSFYGNDPFKQTSKRHYYNFPGVVKRFNASLNNSVAALSIKSFLEHLKRGIWCTSTSVAAVVLPTYGIAQLCTTQQPSDLNKMMRDIATPHTFDSAEKIALFDNIQHAAYAQEHPSLLTKLAGELKGSGGPALALASMLSNSNTVRGIASIIAGAYCALSAKEDYEWARDCIFLETCLQEKLIAVAQCVDALQELENVLTKHPAFTRHLQRIHALHQFLHTKHAEHKRLLTLLDSSTFKGKASPFSCAGRILLTFALMHQLEHIWHDVLVAIGELDSYVSMATLIQESTTLKNNYCFVEFTTSDTPSLEMVDFWNPFLDPRTAITNSLSFGKKTSCGKSNIIVTGPNAGGKSTILRATGINVLLAQTFGIAAAHKMVMTPFHVIATYFNVADDITAGKSKFMAEALRALEMVKKVQKMASNQFACILADELFTGASPREEEAAAFSVAKHIGSFNNVLSIIATHFPMLTQLAYITDNFMNYKVSVTVHKNGFIQYPFLLEPGIAHQHIALDVLNAQGCQSSILDEARAIIAQQDLEKKD